jgi:LysM repeat protein
LASLLPILLPAAAWAQDLPEAASVGGFAGHAQGYSLSCESRSAADWAAFWGVPIGESEFLANLPRSDDPERGFVGNPYDSWGQVPPASYGVHAGPVAQLLRAYGIDAQARSGVEWEQLRAEIAAGRPVIVWVIGQMWAGRPRSYTAADGHTTTVAPFEHTMILTGYSPTAIQVVDAYSGRNLTFSLEAFLTSWSVLGNMAVTAGFSTAAPEMVSAQPTATPSPAPTAPPPVQQTYTVQRGDYLVALAERFQTSWTALVALNAIPYPYTIYPGQVLRLPAGQATAPPTSPAPVAPSPTATPAGALTSTPTAAWFPDAYTVQPGDFLKKIAERFGLDWRRLAELNGIDYPYVIYSGQVLRLK